MSHKILRFAMMIGVGFLWLALSGWAAATTRTVTNFGDNGSPGQLRTLMNLSASGDTIMIPAGTIILTGASDEDANVGGDLDVLKTLIIQGAGPGATIIDGGLNDGVIDILVTHTLTLSGVTIQNGVNSSQAGGGGIRNFGTLNLSNAIVSNNEAARTTAGIRTNGGGIRNLATMSLTNVVITANLARGDGGGIYNELGSVMTLTDVTVSGNTVEIDGGGIYNLGTANLTRVTVSGNNGDTAGGGIFTGGAVPNAATATLTNVTVSGNHVNSFGGGIYNSATAILTNVTVKANDATFSGGGIANFASTTVKNVIVAGNSSVTVPGTANCSGTITSLGHNLESGSGCKFTAPGDLQGTNPLLGPLQDNGGFTFTHALLTGSPAIDAGTNVGCPATDQRGFPRTAVCDIGAYEFVSGTPAAAFSPTNLNSGTVLVGASSGVKKVTLTNTGTGSLIISGVTASGNFSESDTCAGQTLAPAATCDISVTFTPSIVGAIPGALTVSDNASNSPQIVALAGKGVGPVSLAPISLNFGPVSVGATSASKTVTLTNNTSGSLGFTFLASANYSAVGSGTKPCTGTLAAKAKCTMSVTFTPTANGAANGSLAVSSASFPTQLANLVGAGLGGGTSPLTFAPATLSFSSTLVGATSAAKTVTVTNSSASAVNITNFVASGDFSVVGSGITPCGGVLGAGASCTVAVAFSPSLTGMLKGSVTFMDNAPVNTQLYNLTGKAVLPVTFTPASLTFAGQAVGTTSAPKTVKLTNNQAIALNLTSQVASGQYTAAAGGATPCGSTVGAHSSCTFVVTFSPKQTGAIPGVVTVTHNASGNPQAVKLSGTGQ